MPAWASLRNRMMTREKIAHVLRAVVGVTGRWRLVVSGSATVLLVARNIPAAMLNTDEVDVYSRWHGHRDHHRAV
jgi:hypothetical protein